MCGAFGAVRRVFLGLFGGVFSPGFGAFFGGLWGLGGFLLCELGLDVSVRTLDSLILGAGRGCCALFCLVSGLVVPVFWALVCGLFGGVFCSWASLAL